MSGGAHLLPEWVHVVVRLPRAVDIVAEAARYEEHGIPEQLADAAGQASGVKDESRHGKARVMGKGWKPKLAWEPLGVQVCPALQVVLAARAGLPFGMRSVCYRL